VLTSFPTSSSTRFLFGVLCCLVPLTACSRLVPDVASLAGPTLSAEDYEREAAAVAEHPKVPFEQVRNIFESRCAVCHGCYDAPCQLKFSSYEGIDRGVSKDLVYLGERLLAAEPTRLYVDAQTTEEWRKKGFFPVLHEEGFNKPTDWKKEIPKKIATLAGKKPQPEKPRTKESVLLEGSMLFRSLYQKTLMPEAETPEQRKSFTFSTSQDPICPTIETYDGFARVYPHWGMPYGLPPLREKEYQTVVAWLSQVREMTAQERASYAAELEERLARHDRKRR